MPSEIYLILKSYLSKRSFQVKIDNPLSNYHPIQSAVPQGSVLGPFLYLLYTADIPVTEDATMATFADDTAILTSDKNQDRASEKLQNHLDQLQEWLQRWKIKVNNQKSAQITFTTRRSNCPQVTLNNTPIPIKTEVKYLGLHLDQKLTRRRSPSKKSSIKSKIKTNELATGTKITTLSRQQGAAVQDHIETYLDLRDRTLGLQ